MIAEGKIKIKQGHEIGKTLADIVLKEPFVIRVPSFDYREWNRVR